MIISLNKYTKYIVIRVLFALSVLVNIYALTALHTIDTSLAGCESYIEQIETAQAQYVELFGEQE